MTPSERVGQRIRAAREAQQLTQDDIARLLEISQQYCSSYERGIKMIPTRHIITLAQFYNISADYLLGLIDAPRPLGEPSDG